MVRVLVHRGPDDAGLFHSAAPGDPGIPVAGSRSDSNGPQLGGAKSVPAAGAALGFRRLSIIDLEGGHQPLSNEDETIWIVFNGEIYNYRELRPDLEARGHRFRTSSDTETIVHLYEEYGVECVVHLRGMFAFAIWDAPRRRLFLARDRLGQKPLVYREEAGRLLFASELKAILQIPGVPRTLNPHALDEFLTYQYVPHPHCMLKGFHKLPPAHRAIYENGQLTVERYWAPPYPADESRWQVAESDAAMLRGCESWSADRWRTQLRETLTEAVRLRLRSDVPLGAFLSGGIDSTIIAGLMQQISDQPIHTFSIGFPVKQFDERSYAREAAARIGSIHHESIVEPSALDTLPRLIWHYDEPFSDSSAIPTMHLSEITRREVTVALSGDGADELFAGYERYRAVQLAGYFDRLPKFVRRMLASQIWQRMPASVEQKSFRRRVKRFLIALQQPPQERYLRWVGIFDADLRAGLYTAEFQEQLHGADSYGFINAAYSGCVDRDFVTQTTCADVLTYLPCDILTKVDVASMAASLECRSPFLDHQVVQLAARMPMGLKRRGKRGKQILIETFGDLLPESIQTRKKMGFGVPLDHWFRGELKPLLYDVLLDGRTLDRGYFDPDAVRDLVEQHVSGQWDHSYRLWALLCFELWQRMFLDPATVPSSAPESL